MMLVFMWRPKSVRPRLICLEPSYVNIEGIQMRGSTIITDESSSHILLQDMKGEYVGTLQQHRI